MQAANEELQANNEELEATNEELQATNEELISVNEESMRKSADLGAINSELMSVYDTLDFPILVFDTDTCLSRTNDAANRRFHLNNGSLKKPMYTLNFPDYFEDIEKRLSKTLRNGVNTSIVIKPSSQETYNVFITPILNSRDRITGAILVIIDNSELVIAHERIEKSQEQLLSIMNNSLALIALKDNAGRYEFVNSRFEEVFGVTAQEVVGKTDLQIFERETARQFREKDLDTMRTLSPLETLDEFILRAGKVIIKSVRFPIFDAEGTIKSICTQATDISKELHANEQLRLAGKIFERTSEAILVTDANQRILTTNETFAELTGFSQQELTGKTPKMLESGEHSKDFFLAMKASLNERGFWQGEVINKVKDGSHVKMWLTVNAVKGANGDIVNYVAAYSNIDEIKNMQRRIEYLATHDELTGLPNRTVLLERLELMISGAKRSKQLCGVLFVDLDNFKPVNDNLGHKVGDLLLKQVTKRLQQCIRDTDLLARIGGDEFVALISASHIDEIDDIAKRIISQVQNEFDVSTHSISVSASIGIAVYPADGISSEILLQHADEAMYLAKSTGRNQYQYFTAKMKEQALARLEVEKQLKVALDGKQFSMVYQPQFESTSNAIVGAEALLRYKNSDGEVLNAESFINIAERGKLIETIGFHAVELVAREIAQYIQLGSKLPAIAINLSGSQLLTSDFIKNFVAVLDRYELTAGLFKFEVSEKDIESGEERIYHRLRTLASMGSVISIDDYGLYKSAISQLQQSGASEIKLSSRLLADVSDNNDSNKLIHALINAGKALGLKIIADKVETQQQLDYLRDIGCDVVQGLVFSPMLTCAELNKQIS